MTTQCQDLNPCTGVGKIVKYHVSNSVREKTIPNKSFNFAHKKKKHGPDVQKDARPLTQPLGFKKVIMPRSFGLVDYKVKEAEYFLLRIKEAEYDFFGVQFDAVAFTAAARSVTFAMQSSLKGIKDFEEWYETKQEEMKSDSLAKFFNKFRRVSQHIGENVVVGGRTDENGTIFSFGSSPELKEVPEIDVSSACEKYYKYVLEIVYECYLTFPALINGQWRFTQEYFSTIGLTIEDAEEELGLPRGWSEVSGLDEAIRWKYLRKEADGCQIQQQFENWLGKRVPHPDDEL